MPFLPTSDTANEMYTNKHGHYFDPTLTLNFSAIIRNSAIKLTFPRRH